MTQDLVIRGGRIVNGLGDAAQTGDIAIDRDTLVQVGGREGRVLRRGA